MPSFAIIGKICSGKSTYFETLRNAMENEFGIKVYRVPPFSDKIAEIARDLFGMEGKDRSLLQAIANNMREIDSGVWAKYLIRNIKRYGAEPFIAEGFREVSEMEIFRENFPGMIVLKIDVDEKRRLEMHMAKYGKELTREQMENAAETGIQDIKYDILVLNDYTEQGMKKNIKTIIDAVRENSIYGIKALGL